MKGGCGFPPLPSPHGAAMMRPLPPTRPSRPAPPSGRPAASWRAVPPHASFEGRPPGGWVCPAQGRDFFGFFFLGGNFLDRYFFLVPGPHSRRGGIPDPLWDSPGRTPPLKRSLFPRPGLPPTRLHLPGHPPHGSITPLHTTLAAAWRGTSEVFAINAFFSGRSHDGRLANTHPPEGRC